MFLTIRFYQYIYFFLFNRKKLKSLGSQSSIAARSPTHTKQQSAMMLSIFGDQTKKNDLDKKMDDPPSSIANPMKKLSGGMIKKGGNKSVQSASTKPDKATNDPAAAAADNKGSLNTSFIKAAKKVVLTLPEHWTEHEDPSSGKKYFYHTKNKSTSWTRPVSTDAATPTKGHNVSKSLGHHSMKAAAKMVVATLPEHWTEHKDPTSGKTYFFNTKNQSTSWTRPTATNAALPPNWTAVTDKAGGKTYYHNNVTNETSWTIPTE
jgi:hypothetical protein